MAKIKLRKPCEMKMEEVRDCLDYNPDTGKFIWKKKRRGRIKIGDVAGIVNKHNGYRYICVNMCTMLAHRMVWLYIHGQHPAEEIDHINGIRDDNRIANLREASRFENHANKWNKTKSQTGLRGVSKSRSGKFVAFINKNKKNTYLGTFQTKEEASIAYKTEAQKIFGPYLKNEGLA